MEIQIAHLNEKELEKHKLGLAMALQLREQGGDIDALLTCLRHHEYNLIDCILILREMDGIGLGDAKVAVLESPAWRDKAIEHEKMLDSLLSEYDDLDTAS